MTTAPVAPAPEYLEVHLADVITDEAKGEVEGLALPYGEVLKRPDYATGATRQSFAPGAAKVRPTAQLYYGHDHQTGGMPIGRVLSGEQTDKGLRLHSRFAKTAKAAEVQTLATPDEDGIAVLDRYSVGYIPIASRLEEDGDLLVHTEVDVFEVSIVPLPAYDSAVIDTVLHRPNPAKEVTTMTATTLELDPATLASAEDVKTLSTSVEDLGRKIATLGSTAAEKDGPNVPAASYGEFLQKLAAGDKDAADFLAYVGGTIGDLGDWVKDSWVGDIYKPITEQRRLHNLFSSSPLPASGMNVEYGKLLADTTQVAEQVNEGDTLAYGKLEFTTATAPLKTYGGWGEMSRQEIERSPMAVVEMFYSALVNRYAKVTEAALRTVVANVANSHALAGTGVSDLTTADGWIDFIVDASFWLDDHQGLSPEFLIVGRDKFKALAKLRDGDNADSPRFLDRTSGSISVTGLSGQVFNIPVIPVNVNGLVRVGHSSAIRTFEAGGQPFRLQDDDITNLTKAFSIYGYEAIAVQDPNAIVSPDVTA